MSLQSDWGMSWTLKLTWERLLLESWVARSPPTDAGAGDAESSPKGSREAVDVVPMENDELGCTAKRVASDTRPGATEVADRAQPKSSGTETCKHRARG